MLGRWKSEAQSCRIDIRNNPLTAAHFDQLSRCWSGSVCLSLPFALDAHVVATSLFNSYRFAPRGEAQRFESIMATVCATTRAASVGDW